MRILILVFAIALGICVAYWRAHTLVPPTPKGIPLSAMADGKPHPEVGLIAPLPAWMPLPEEGTVVGAELFRGSPPWGSGAVVMLKLARKADAFTAAYAKRLSRAGFSFRRIASPPNLIIDAPYATYEADDRAGGNTLFVTIRSYWEPLYAQLTFYNAPAPRQP